MGNIFCGIVIASACRRNETAAREDLPVKTLLLLRHAKAAESSVDATDHARPLAARGTKDAKAIAAHLRANGFSIERIYASSSQRTKETYDAIAPALPGVPVAYRDRLYLVDASDLLEFIQGLPDNVGSVMIIGHNPTFYVVAMTLAREAAPGQETALAALKEKFPTGALCSLQFNVAHWKEVRARGGTLTGFVRPKDLED